MGGLTIKLTGDEAKGKSTMCDAAFPRSSAWRRYDSHGWVSLRCRSLGERGTANYYSSVLVPRLPISGRRQWNGGCLLSHRNVQGHRKDERFRERGRQRESNAPPVLPGLRHSALQRGRGTTTPDLRSSGHFRRSESCHPGDDDMDIQCAKLGLHRCGPAAAGRATATRSIARPLCVGPTLGRG